MKTRALAIVAVGAAALTALPAAQAARTVAQTYGPGPVVSLADCGLGARAGAPGAFNLGAGCVNLEPGESSVTVTVADEVAGHVLVRVDFDQTLDPEDSYPRRIETLATAVTCDGGTFEVPEGADIVAVHLQSASGWAIAGISNNPDPCDGTAELPTTGTITFDLS